MTLSEEERRIHLEGAFALKLNINNLPELNCCSPEAKAHGGFENLESWVQSKYPEHYASWNSSYNPKVRSMAAAAYEAGDAPLTEAVHKELMSTSEMYVKQFNQRQKAKEEALLKEWEEKAADSRERRTGKREIDDTPNFGSGWQAQSRKRQWELDKALGGSWN